MMETCTLVRTEHLNHYGRLFGGQMLRWVDEFAWIAATQQFPEHSFVTRALEHVEFKHQVGNGEILIFKVNMSARGKTSVSYAVEVFAQSPQKPGARPVFTTTVVLVAVDENGRKKYL